MSDARELVLDLYWIMRRQLADDGRPNEDSIAAAVATFNACLFQCNAEVIDLCKEIQEIKWLIDEGPAHVKLTEAQIRLTKLKDIISAHDARLLDEAAERATAWVCNTLGYELDELEEDNLRAAVRGEG